MFFTRVYRIAGDSTEAKFIEAVRWLEKSCGTVVAVSRAENSSDTWTTHAFTLSADRPAKPVQVVTFSGSQPPLPPQGTAAICIGHCVIGDTERNILLYR